MSLTPGDQSKISEHMEFCRTDREKKGQFLFPSCGCVFKNDYTVGVPSGLLIEASGMKGVRVGNAEVSEYHANFVFNRGATSRQILELTMVMREAVFRNFGVWMEYEMEVMGVIPEDLRARFYESRSATPNDKLRALQEKFAKKNNQQKSGWS